MLCSLTSFSQTTVTIGDESGYEIGETDYPINRRYNTHSSAEIIYWQSEINTEGAITQIAFYKTSGSNTNPHPDITIYIKHTSDDTFSSGVPSLSGYSKVFEGNYTNNSTTGWMEVTLDTPFEYNNTENLQVAVINNSGVSLEAAGPRYRRTNYGSSPRIRTYAMSTSYNWTEQQHTAANQRPNIRLGIDDNYVPECSVPTSLEVDSITYNSAILNWTESGTANTWDIELLINGATPTGTPTISGITSKPFLYSGLTASTEYDFYVRADCGDSNYSSWSGPYAFQTKSLEETFISLSGNAFQPGQFIGTTNEQPLILKSFNNEGIRISNEGFVGIGGIEEPEVALDVYGKMQVRDAISISTNDTITELRNGAETSMIYNLELVPRPEPPWPPFCGSKWLTLQPSTSSYNQAGIIFVTSLCGNITAYERMRITPEGFVGIGTENPREKLTVKGKILSEENIVVLCAETSQYPDYVFEEDYELISLSELENFIKTYGHLPEIPTAAEVEENGMQLGEMTIKLLKKVEELTLYIIELQKQIEEINKK